jgi:hypothetical protein
MMTHGSCSFSKTAQLFFHWLVLFREYSSFVILNDVFYSKTEVVFSLYDWMQYCLPILEEEKKLHVYFFYVPLPSALYL